MRPQLLGYEKRMLLGPDDLQMSVGRQFSLRATQGSGKALTVGDCMQSQQLDRSAARRDAATRIYRLRRIEEGLKPRPGKTLSFRKPPRCLT